MLDRLGWAWRLMATGLCFVSFGIGGVLMWAVVFPLLSLVVRTPHARSRIARWVIGQAFRGFVGLMRWLGVLTYEVRGLDRLDRPGLLILANHPSLIDVVFLISLTRKADCVVKAALLRNPFTRGAVLAAGFICNNSGPSLLSDCIASVRAGNHLIIFPEGTRTIPGEALKLQRGAANVAVRGRFPITPVVITCDPATLTKGEPWWHVPARRPHFCLTVQGDLMTEELVQGCASEAVAARRLTDFLTAYFTSENRRDHRH